MTGIFDELITDWHKRARLLHHHHGQPAYDHDQDQGDTMNLTGMHDTIAEGLGNIKGWADNLEQQLPAIAAKAAQIDQSPIVAALDGVTLPPEAEQAVAAIIGSLAAAHAKAAAAEVQQPTEAQPVTA